MPFVFGMLLVFLFFLILYWVVKAAVRHAIWELRHEDAETSDSAASGAPQRDCPSCQRRHDFDYPKCPYCGHVYESIE